MKYLLTLLILIYHFSTATAQICFNAGQPISISNPSCVVSADFNNDGNADLAIGRSPSSIFIYSGNGNGTFVYTFSLSIQGGFGVRSIACADLNNDNNIDLVALTAYASARVAHGAGNGSFTLAAPSYSGCTDPLSVIIGEFNNDNQKDLFITNLCSQFLTYFSGTTNGIFNSFGTHYSGIGNTNYAATTGDFNKDGNLDIASISESNKRVYVMMGQGTNSFSPHVSYTVGTGPKAIASADFNQDGNIDLSVGISGSDSVAVLLGSATGAFSAPVRYKCGLRPEYMAARDMNNDGQMDIVITNTLSGNNYVSLMLNNNGSFGSALNFTIGNNPTGLAVADFNNDNRPDIATTGGLANSVNLWISATPVITGPSTLCAGSLAVLNASALPGINSFTWHPGGSSPVNGATLAISPTVSTTYSVAATNTLNGCVATAVKQISVLAIPSLTINSSKPVICVGETVTITVAGAQSYSWNIGSASTVIVAKPTSSFTYQVIGTGSNNCSSQATYIQTVNTCIGLKAQSGSLNNPLFYPNPGNGIFKIADATAWQDAEVKVYNSVGQLVRSYSLQSNLLIDLSEEAAGIYIYHVQHKDGAVSGKLVISR